MERLFPPQWKRVGLAAPASMPDKEEFDRAAEFLRSQGLKIVYGFDPREKDILSYLSASPQVRLDHLNDLICNPEVDAIYCIRGGFGSIHLLEGIDFETLAQRKLPLIGYSDITALHMALIRKKAAVPVSGCMALKLEEEGRNSALFSACFRRALILAHAKKSASGQEISSMPFCELCQVTPLNETAAETKKLRGKLICGNITVMTSLCGTEFFPSFRNRILLLEEVGEMPRRIDACLHQLKLNKVFEHCRGVIFGNFKDCAKGESRDLEWMLQRFGDSLECPVYAGLHFGHCRGSWSFLQEEELRLQEGRLFCRTPKELFTAERS